MRHIVKAEVTLWRRGCRQKFSPAPVFVCYLPAWEAEILHVKRNIFFLRQLLFGWNQAPLKLLLKVKPQFITVPHCFKCMECWFFYERAFIRFPFLFRIHSLFHTRASAALRCDPVEALTPQEWVEERLCNTQTDWPYERLSFGTLYFRSLSPFIPRFLNFFISFPLVSPSLCLRKTLSAIPTVDLSSPPIRCSRVSFFLFVCRPSQSALICCKWILATSRSKVNLTLTLYYVTFAKITTTLLQGGYTMNSVESFPEMPQGAACFHSHSSMRLYVTYLSNNIVWVTHSVVCNHLPFVFVAISLIYITGCSTGISVLGKLVVVSGLTLLNIQFSLIGW